MGQSQSNGNVASSSSTDSKSKYKKNTETINGNAGGSTQIEETNTANNNNDVEEILPKTRRPPPSVAKSDYGDIIAADSKEIKDDDNKAVENGVVKEKRSSKRVTISTENGDILLTNPDGKPDEGKKVKNADSNKTDSDKRVESCNNDKKSKDNSGLLKTSSSETLDHENGEIEYIDGHFIFTDEEDLSDVDNVDKNNPSRSVSKRASKRESVKEEKKRSEKLSVKEKTEVKGENIKKTKETSKESKSKETVKEEKKNDKKQSKKESKAKKDKDKKKEKVKEKKEVLEEKKDKDKKPIEETKTERRKSTSSMSSDSEMAIVSRRTSMTSLNYDKDEKVAAAAKPAEVKYDDLKSLVIVSNYHQNKQQPMKKTRVSNDNKKQSGNDDKTMVLISDGNIQETSSPEPKKRQAKAKTDSEAAELTYVQSIPVFEKQVEKNNDDEGAKTKPKEAADDEDKDNHLVVLQLDPGVEFYKTIIRLDKDSEDIAQVKDVFLKDTIYN